ncbi:MULTISPECIES: bifunctional diguanylate cyclase/phosphodiesterase [Anaerolinea]|uniref:putative bifunctional diguanylate cyclase/phosphodiesterase n=1 Tax=Anaerolinea TaxID=233189 RepID=UPI0026232289|nr:bifunctional diguanylate cyclase/phosphodiesterase [Anaerolinea thermophila]
MEKSQQFVETENEILVQECLRVIANLTGAKRAHLHFLLQERKFEKEAFFWADSPEGLLECSEMAAIRLDHPWWVMNLRAQDLLKIEDLTRLPEEVSADRQALQHYGVHNLLILPVYDGKRLAGMIRLENVSEDLSLQEIEISLLHICAQLIVRMLCLARDLGELRRDRARIAHHQEYDDLTGLPNRTLFLERVKQAFEGNSSLLFAVLVIDIDYYQLIHERFGRAIAERLVQAAVNKIRLNLRAEDLMARLGEDQFGVLIQDVQDRSVIEMVATRILERVREPFVIEGDEVAVTASIGIALRNGHLRTPEEILQEAGIALLEAKQSGRGKWLVFDESMREELIRRMEVENDLRRSLEENRLILHYQPITELKSGRLIGFEALVRWIHPRRGMIWPTEFIEISEKTGLIVPLGLWVLRQACWQMHLWQERFPINPPLMISVNISPRQLEEPDFSEQVKKILEETGLPPSSLRLEITEHTVVQRSGALIEALDSLRTLGVQLYIDDFGTGYSSLGYLDRLPVDAIKIDRSFVSNLGKAKSSQGVVQAIIQLAHELNIEVVAEGVETFEQHRELKRLQCEFMQGFYISEPLDVLAVERFIAGRSGFVFGAD